MKIVVAACAGVIVVALLAGAPAPAAEGCVSRSAEGACAPLHLIDHEDPITELRRRAYERGYRDALRRYEDLAPPRRVYRDRRGEWRDDWRDAQLHDMRQYPSHFNRDNPGTQSER